MLLAGNLLLTDAEVWIPNGIICPAVRLLCFKKLSSSLRFLSADGSRDRLQGNNNNQLGAAEDSQNYSIYISTHTHTPKKVIKSIRSKPEMSMHWHLNRANCWDVFLHLRTLKHKGNCTKEMKGFTCRFNQYTRWEKLGLIIEPITDSCAELPRDYYTHGIPQNTQDRNARNMLLEHSYWCCVVTISPASSLSLPLSLLISFPLSFFLSSSRPSYGHLSLSLSLSVPLSHFLSSFLFLPFILSCSDWLSPPPPSLFLSFSIMKWISFSSAARK